MLSDVCIPGGFGGFPIAYFDDYSWRAFLALVWPAANNDRGLPDEGAMVGAPDRPTVFETFKAEWEIFQPNGVAPAAWNEYGGANPCELAGIEHGDLVLAAFSKYDNIGQAGFGPRLVGPLVAQNQTYVRFSTGFNRIEFDDIVANQLYLRKDPWPDFSFRNGAVDIKASWIDMENIANPERFYTREAWFLNLDTESCSRKRVGLVGLHIVVKTPSRPQWIWATFEHVDNVSKDAGAAATFNAGNAEAMPDKNPIGFPPPDQPPHPFNVDRLKPIADSTEDTNAAYQQLLEGEGSVWRFYELVMTQWPIPVGDPSVPGTPANTSPGAGATTSFSNVTMETFEQEQIQTGCMNCHNSVRRSTDFLWTIFTRAHPSLLAISASQPPSPMSFGLDEDALLRLGVARNRMAAEAPAAGEGAAAPLAEPFSLSDQDLEALQGLERLLSGQEPQ